MKGADKVIEYLNAALRSELTAVSQYWLHYKLQEDWGLGHMAKKSREESIEEMNHADRIIARIIFLGGHPNLQKLDPLRIGENALETIEVSGRGFSPASPTVTAAASTRRRSSWRVSSTSRWRGPCRRWRSPRTRCRRPPSRSGWSWRPARRRTSR